MGGNLLSLQAALNLLCTPQGDYDYSDFADRIWPFLEAFTEFDEGMSILEEYGTFVARQTSRGSEYHKAWRAGIKACLHVDPPLPMIVDAQEATTKRVVKREITSAIHQLRSVRCGCNSTPRLREVCDLIKLAISQGASDGVVELLHAWWRAGQKVISRAIAIHADDCRLLLEAHRGGLAANETHIINAIPKVIDDAIRSAAKRLAEEVQQRVQSPKSSPAYVSTSEVQPASDELLTLDQLAKLAMISPKTLRNRKILGPPAVKGGGKGKKSLWRYSDEKRVIEMAFSRQLPNFDEAIRALSRQT